MAVDDFWTNTRRIQLWRTMIMMWSVSVFCVWQFGVEQVAAQEPYMLIHELRYSTNPEFKHSNLRSNTIRCIMQDKHGFVWIGTNKGVDRWDGYSTTQRFDTSQIGVNAFTTDAAGVLWAATERGMKRLLSSVGMFQNYSFFESISPDGTPQLVLQHVSALYPDAAGMLWMAQNNTLYGYNPFTGITERYARSIQSNIATIRETSNGVLWISTNDNELHILSRDRTLEKSYRIGEPTYTLLPAEAQGMPFIQRTSGALYDSIGVVHADKQGNVRFQAFGSSAVQRVVNLLKQQYGGECTLHAFENLHSPLDSGYVWLSMRNAANTYRNGLYYVHLSTKNLPQKPLVQGVITAFYRNTSGIVWVGVKDAGVRQLVPTGMKFLTHLPDSTVTVLHKDQHGTLWIGTRNGVAAWNPASNTALQGASWRQFLVQSPLSPSSGRIHIHDITETPDGSILFATSLGVYRYSYTNGRCVQDAALQRVAAAQSVSRIFARRSSQEIWMYADTLFGVKRCSYTGAALPLPLAKDTLDIIHEPITAFFEDSRGTFWVGDEWSFRRWIPEAQAFAQYASGHVIGIYEDAERNVVALFRDGTLGMYNSITNRFEERFSTVPEHVVSAAIDRRGVYWMMQSDNTVLSWSPKLYNTSAVRILAASDIQSVSARMFPAIHRAADGMMYIGYKYGVLEYKPDSVRLPFWQNAPFAVSSVRINGALWQNSLANGDTLTVYTDDVFSLELALLNYADKATDFLYKLSRYDTVWVRTGEDHTARYGRLPAGTYRLDVQIAQGSLVQASAFTMILLVRPYFWQTAVFRLSLLAGIAVGAFGLVVYRLRLLRDRDAARREEAEARMRQSEAEYARERAQIQLFAAEQKKRELQREKEMMERFATEFQLKTLHLQLNPHFLHNALMSLQTLILKNDTKAASYYVEVYSRLLRTIIDQSRQVLTSLMEELTFLQAYIELEQFRLDSCFSFSINTQKIENTSLVYIPPMLIQPYIENAIRHGLQPLKEEGFERAGVLRISFQTAEECLLCEIEDNGIGRDRAWERSHGSSAKGLSMSTQLLEERLQLLGHFHERRVEVVYTDLTDTEHHPLGTRIALSIPLFSPPPNTPPRWHG